MILNCTGGHLNFHLPTIPTYKSKMTKIDLEYNNNNVLFFSSSTTIFYTNYNIEIGVKLY